MIDGISKIGRHAWQQDSPLAFWLSHCTSRQWVRVEISASGALLSPHGLRDGGKPIAPDACSGDKLGGISAPELFAMENTIATRKETKTAPKTDVGQHQSAGRFEHGQANSHNVHDRKDQYSLDDRAALEKKLEKEEAKATDAPSAGWWDDGKPRPTQIAERHGNKPSKGAIIDEQIQNEEFEELKRKGKI